MNGENWPLVTDEPAEFENNRLQFKTSGEWPIIIEEFMEHTSNYEEKPKITSVGLGNTRILTDYAQKSPGTLLSTV
jgi:hypothetical protein